MLRREHANPNGELTEIVCKPPRHGKLVVETVAKANLAESSEEQLIEVHRRAKDPGESCGVQGQQERQEISAEVWLTQKNGEPRPPGS